MSHLQNELKSHAQVKRILSEMPWLWAVNNFWGTHCLVIQQADSATLDIELPDDVLYAYSVGKLGERVEKIEVERKRVNPTVYDALKQLHDSTALLPRVTRIATTVRNHTRVYRCRKEDTFEKLFLVAHHEKTRV